MSEFAGLESVQKIQAYSVGGDQFVVEDDDGLHGVIDVVVDEGIAEDADSDDGAVGAAEGEIRRGKRAVGDGGKKDRRAVIGRQAPRRGDGSRLRARRRDHSSRLRGRRPGERAAHLFTANALAGLGAVEGGEQLLLP